MANHFWNERGLEPKRKFRWLLYLSGMPQFIVKNVKKPSFNVATSNHQFLNYEFYYPGRVTWQPITITIVDPIDPDSTASLYNILQQSGYNPPNEYRQNEAMTISKKKMVESLGTEIKLVQLDAEGKKPIETWIIKNPILQSVDFDQLDYGSDELLNISMTIAYDFATVTTRPTAAGSKIWALNRNATFTGDDAAKKDAWIDPSSIKTPSS